MKGVVAQGLRSRALCWSARHQAALPLKWELRALLHYLRQVLPERLQKYFQSPSTMTSNLDEKQCKRASKTWVVPVLLISRRGQKFLQQPKELHRGSQCWSPGGRQYKMASMVVQVRALLTAFLEWA